MNRVHMLNFFNYVLIRSSRSFRLVTTLMPLHYPIADQSQFRYQAKSHQPLSDTSPELRRTSQIPLAKAIRLSSLELRDTRLSEIARGWAMLASEGQLPSVVLSPGEWPRDYRVIYPFPTHVQDSVQKGIFGMPA